MMSLPELTLEQMATLLKSVASPSLFLKVGQTYPPIQAFVSDNNGPYNLTVITTIEFAMLGMTSATLRTGFGVSRQTAFTADTANASNRLLNVSLVTGLFGPELDGSRPGSILIGPGIPPPVFDPATQTWASTTVQSIVGSTVTMSANATAPATGAAFTGNQGLIEYGQIAADTAVADLYAVEWKLTLTGGRVLFVPNEQALNQSIQVDPTLGE